MVIRHFEIKDIKLNISGKDLIKAGFKQGTVIGKILDKLLSEKLNNCKKFNNKHDEINWVLKSFHKN